MYTTVPRQEVVEHRPRPGDPALEIIDHREKPQHNRTKKKRPEQLPYDTLKTQRDTLYKQELTYKKRIEELEKDSRELLKNYESTYEENMKLKRILDNGPNGVKMKQLSKEKREQKGLIEQLKDENKSLEDKLAELEKEVQAEKLKAHEKGWDVQLSKVKKKREEEDSIPTEGPFVAGHIAKPRRMMLHDEDGDKQVDAYDLEVDSLEKETQVLLNKVKILKREKEQIDYATLMGKGAVSKNKVVAKAINDKLNKDLNKFVMRLQMLKMKQNAARTFFTVVTDESNPIIQVKQKEMANGKISPNSPTRGGNMSSRSWKKQSGDSQETSRSDNGKYKVSDSPSKLTDVTPTISRFANPPNKGKVSAQSSKAPSLKSGNNSRKQSFAESEISLTAHSKNNGNIQRRNVKSPPLDNGDTSSAGIWRKVQSNKLSGKMRTEARVKSETAKADDSQQKREKPQQQSVMNGIPNKKTAVSTSTKDNSDVQNTKTKGKENDSTGRYSNGPEPIGYKPISKTITATTTKSTNKKIDTKPFSTYTSKFGASSKESAPYINGRVENEGHIHHDHGKIYRINGVDDGYSMIRLHNHVKEIDKTDHANPIPIHFKTRRSLDVREGRSIIGNSGIRQDAFYRRLNDNDPYFGL